LERIAAAADLANQMDPAASPRLVQLLTDSDPAVRYWAAVGLGAVGKGASPGTDALRAALADPSPIVRVAAADALCRLDEFNGAVPVLIKGLQDDNEWVRVLAANVLDRIDEHARPALAALEQAKADKNQYVVRVVEHALQHLKR
jgi:uncharacterized sulfatase